MTSVDGGCHCGEITFEADLEPEAVGICHCTDCQALSATAFRVFGMIAPGNFRLLSGDPKIYVKTGDSGNPREQAFCGNCGSAIYASDTGEDPKPRNLRMGVVRQRDQFPPRFQVWCRSALPWLPPIETNRKLERQ